MFKYIALLPFILFSCSVGNFMDIGNNSNTLYAFAGTSTAQFFSYRIDTESKKIESRNSMSLAGSIKSIAVDKKNNRLFVSSYSDIYGFQLYEDGGVSTLPGFPVATPVANEIDKIFFINDYNYLFVTYGSYSSDLYGYSYDQGSGNISLLSGYPVTLTTLPVAVHSTNGLAFMYQYASWYRADINSDGSFSGSTALSSVSSALTSVPAYGSYICNFHDNGASPHVGIYIYSFGVDSAEINTPQSFVSVTPAASLSAFNSSYGNLFYCSTSEPLIYSIDLYNDGSINSTIKSFPTTGITAFTALNSHGDYLLFASGSYPANLNLMELNSEGYPGNGISDSITVYDNINCIEFFSYND